MTERTAVADMLLADRYRLERAVGSGPCTTLWRAFDEVLTRPVAVKILDKPAAVPGCADTADAIRRFTTAATSVGRLAHPRIASTYDAGDDDGLAYIVSEWVDGSALAELVREGPLRPAHATTIGAQAAEALGYAHATGCQHGDIDGYNVLVCPDGGIKFTDFGVAAALADRSPPAELTVLPAEQRDTRELAALVYLCLTGRSVYGSEADLAAAPRSEGRLLSPREVRAGVPRELDTTVMRALEPAAVRGAAPITSPDELLAELARLPGDEGSQATMVISDDLLPPRPPGRLLRVGVPLVLVLVLALAAVAIGVQVSRLPDDGSDPSPSGSPAAAATPGGLAKLRPSTAADFDPDGDGGGENGSLVPRAFDGDPTTAWRTERYDSATLGNLKKGVGLVIDLGKPVAVREVRLVLLEDGATVQLRAAASRGESADSFDVVGEKAGAGKSVVLAPRAGTRAQYWLVWLTKLPPSRGGFRAQVGEVEFYS